MLISLEHAYPEATDVVTLRCPKCRKLGNFYGMKGIQDIRRTAHQDNEQEEFYLGQRICPDERCMTHVFVVLDERKKVIRSYPPQRIDFESKAIPVPIVKTFEEALICYAENLYVAAAIMIRRTLEEICHDKGVKGKDLRDRIIDLKNTIVLPQGLIEAFDELRLLGNDAAHIEAKTYEEIGSEELSVAIDVTREILKAIYQMDELLSRLRALKKRPA